MPPRKSAKGKLVVLKPGQKVVGKGFFGDLWRGIKSGVSAALPIVKSSGVIGNLAGAFHPLAGAAVKSQGYGRKRKRAKGQVMGEGRRRKL